MMDSHESTMAACTATSAIGVTWQSFPRKCCITGTSIRSLSLPWLQTTSPPFLTGPCCASVLSTLVWRTIRT